LEVHLPEDQKARLGELAVKTGRGLKSWCNARMLEHGPHFLDAVKAARASARRGELLEHDEVVERIEQMFRP
jgi:predicted transcriptional regulator